MAVTFPNGSAGGPQQGEVRPDAVSAGFARPPQSYAIPQHAPSLAEAQAYCEKLARSHYENFSVASWFLPRNLRKHFFSVYSYCRISDDLGDEVGDTQLSLALLDRWEQELAATYEKLNNPSADGSRHPVFVALAETICEFQIPQHEFSDLLVAFRQDQTVTRYPKFEDVLGYCHYSANPVGHLVLYVCGYRDAERQLLSDYTCTALQLANFWQDVAVDWEKNRVYLPLEDLAHFGVSENDIAERRFTPAVRELMRFEVERAREWFERGLPLVRMVNRELALDLELFSRGGLAILDAIEKQDYNVLAQRPVVSKSRKMMLLLRALAGKVKG